MKHKKTEVVCVIVAHPDDIEICCFGTLKKLKESGARIEVLIMTNGVRGVEVTQKESQLASIVSSGYRREEAREALDHLVDINWGNFPDGQLSIDGETISYVDRFLKIKKPDLVITHPMALPVDHYDHYVTHSAVRNSIQRLPKPSEVWYFEPIVSARIGWVPNLLVDITDYFPDKMEAMQKHKTQAGRIYLTEQWHRHRSEQHSLAVNSNLFSQGKIYESFLTENVVW